MKRTNPTRSVPHAYEDGDDINQSARPGGVYPSSHKRIASTNGSFPVNQSEPKRPPIMMLYDDMVEELGPPTVYGMYPAAFIGKILPWLRCERREVLHLCSGALPRGEGIRVDIRPEALPDHVADAARLPRDIFPDGSAAAVLLDPPYTKAYASTLYGVKYPVPARLLAEAARVVRPGGRIGFVHYITPAPAPGTRIVKVFGLSTGFDMPIRAVVIYERGQDELFKDDPVALSGKAAP